MTTTPKPYGHAAIVIRREYGKTENTQIQIRRKGPRSAVEHAARMLSGFIELVSIDAYTREEWVRVFGEGTEHGPYRRKVVNP